MRNVSLTQTYRAIFHIIVLKYQSKIIWFESTNFCLNNTDESLFASNQMCH